ncbi:MAG: hypothetical protein NVSMB44_21730 [Ktedonobacteraceae bacterium]
MRPLSNTLTAAVNSATHRPYVTLSAEDHIVHFGQFLVTSGNADSLCDMGVMSDGSIIRVRVTRGTSGLQQSFQWQRISDPTNAAQWQSWTTFGGGSANMFQDGGCALMHNGALLLAFAQQGSGGNALWSWQSNDGGQTWSATPATVLTLPGNVFIKGIASSGNNDCFFLYDVSGGQAIGATFLSSTWSPLQTWTLPTLSGSSGLAVAWQNNLYTLVYSDGYSLKACTTNNSATSWTTLPDVATTTSTAIARFAPHLAYIDGRYNLICVEADNGQLTGSVYAYPRVRQSTDLLHWSSGYILQEMPGATGTCFAKCTPPGSGRARYVVACMQRIEFDSDFQSSDNSRYLDLSANILAYQRSEEIGRPGKMTLNLDNSHSSLTPFVATYGSSYQSIGLNTTLALGEGYKTGNPPGTPEAIGVAKYRIKQIIFERSPELSQIHIEAEDLSSLLDEVNRYQVSYSNQSLSWMLSDVCARAGLFSLALPTTQQMNTAVLNFILHAGQKYRQALDELCRVGWLEYFLDQNETLQFRELSSSDSPVWSYAPEIATLTLGSADQRANHVIVIGKPPGDGFFGSITNGEAYDTTHMHTAGLERLLINSDPKLTTSSLCASKAAFILQQEQRDQVAHSITVPANPALQLLDVIAISDQPLALGTGKSTSARIYHSEVHFQPALGQYDMKLSMEGI